MAALGWLNLARMLNNQKALIPELPSVIRVAVSLVTPYTLEYVHAPIKSLTSRLLETLLR